MKTIQRTDDIPKNANWTAIDASLKVWWYGQKPFQSDVVWVGRTNAGGLITHMKPYCKNWKKSLRKIVDKKVNKPSRKELHATIAELNKKLNAYPVAEDMSRDLKIANEMVKELRGELEKQALLMNISKRELYNQTNILNKVYENSRQKDSTILEYRKQIEDLKTNIKNAKAALE